ncbi:MAG: glycerophosphodiester phosphodiesterase, partial [Bacteroidales bacterium]|nr:glycerophosphodiester phosphodiesterase [Bacteroidales bacterium]
TVTVTPHSDPEAEPVDDEAPKPLDPGNKVVAHRGGATECGYPDNSRAALRYAMNLGCYASECDIYWTSDNDVIVAHADSKDQVNGMNPWEHTAAEIIAAKRLSNYERIPTLSEYIDIVMETGSKTKLLLDIKMIDNPSVDYDHPAKAALRAIEIIQEKNAQNFCEFICTSYEGVMSRIAPAIKASGIPCGWMNGSISASTFKSKGYTDWANLNTRDHFKLGSGEDQGTGYRTITEYKNAGLQLSVFHIDKQSGNSSAVYTDATVQLYLDEYQYLRCITTNYPAWLLQKTKDL